MGGLRQCVGTCIDMYTCGYSYFAKNLMVN